MLDSSEHGWRPLQPPFKLVDLPESNRTRVSGLRQLPLGRFQVAKDQRFEFQ